MKRTLSILTLFSFFFSYSSTFAQSVDELVTYQPLENTFITCSKSSLETEESTSTETTPQPPNCIVWYPTSASTTESENTDGIEVLGFLNARYYDANQGQFISQDPVFWELGLTKDGQQALLNPQSQNSYSYGNNNPIVNKDPQGRFVPLAVAAGYVLEAGIAAMTGYSIYNVANNYSNGTQDQLSTMDYVSAVPVFGTVGKVGKGVEIASDATKAGSAVLKDLKVVPTAEVKLAELATKFNSTKNEILQYVQQNGKAFLDNRSGNINYLADRLDGAKGYIRVTVEPTFNRLISAGLNKSKDIINGIKNEKLTPLNK